MKVTRKRVLIGLAGVFILLWAWFIWPTPYQRWEYLSNPGGYVRGWVQFRENRITGTLEHRIWDGHGREVTEWAK